MNSLPYFVIVYQPDKERVNYVDSQIEKFKDKDFHIIPAITPLAIKDFILEHSITVGPGQYLAHRLACYLSHYLALDIIINQGIDQAFILEDDFILPDNHDLEIDHIFEELPTNYDIIRLFHSDYFEITPLTNKIYIGEQSAPDGDVGNLVSAQGALKIRSMMEQSISKNLKIFPPCRRVIETGFIPNDNLIYNMGRQKSLISFNSVNVVVDTNGDVNKIIKRPLRSNINKNKDYYTHSALEEA